jgi:hypothetical protein
MGVLDARVFRYDIENGAHHCAQSGHSQQCFLGVTLRYITLHGWHHFLNVLDMIIPCLQLKLTVDLLSYLTMSTLISG